MSDAPAESNPRTACASATSTERAALLELYSALERAPDELALWPRLNNALR